MKCTTLDTLKERGGYLCRLENTDAWFIAHHRPPESLPEALMEAEDVDHDDAYALIDTGLVKAGPQYSLAGGTTVAVYTLAEHLQQPATG
ncbi:MAG TPA: hypothetical protein VNH21_04605 [Steroidobacteraceae bacterium]|nr:hypothetical protein [Steroidobacteraceae bacterium]